MIIFSLIALCILKFDIHFKKEWDGIYFIYKTVERDLISTKYYETHNSYKFINFKK